MKSRFYLLALLALCLPVHAEGPEHRVFSQVNGLSVSHDVESNPLRSVLYATNHEDFPVLCDAEMKTDKQEKQKVQQAVIDAHKTKGYAFKHRQSVQKIQLYLICVRAEGDVAKAATLPDTPVTAQEPSRPTVKVEELGTP